MSERLYLSIQSMSTNNTRFLKRSALQVLNECVLTWSAIVTIAPCLPHLKELYLSGNDIQSISSPTTPGALFPELEVLDLQDNGLSSWDMVKSLSDLPKLRQLKLNGNPIKSVEYVGALSLGMVSSNMQPLFF